MLLVSLVLSLSAILVFETIRRDSYTSYAQLYASGEVQVGVANLFSEESQTYYGTQIELLKSARLQNAAFERIGYVPKANEKRPVLEVVRPQNTSILEVQVTAADPMVAQRFLQALIDEYLSYKKETRRSTSEDVVASLTDQLAEKEKDLKAGQEKWTQFERSNNVAVLEEESKSAGLYLSDLSLQLAKLKLESGLLAAGYNPAAIATMSTNAVVSASQTNVAGADEYSGVAGTLLDVPGNSEVSASDAGLQAAKVDLEVLRAQQNQALADHGEAAARRMDDSITNQEQRVAILENQNVEDRKVVLDQLQKRVSAIQASIPIWEEKVLDLNERLAESGRIKNDIAREQAYYDHLLATLQNVDLSRNVQPERLSVLQPPTAGVPVVRYLAIRIFLAVAFGLAFGLGIVFCWYLLDDRFVSVRDVREQFGEVILGLVPRVKVPREKPEQALLQTNDSRLAYVESFRHLRSALLLSSGRDKRPQVLLFTGAAPAEGKTTIAMNLARVLAVSGLRIVVVDADSRNGQMHRLFGNPNDIGLLDYLRGDADIGAVAHQTSVPGLEFVPIGTRPDEADGAFLRPGLEKLLEKLKDGRDFVILDGPPILAADDASLLVPHTDMVLTVVRPFFSRSCQVRRTLDMLYQRQAREVAIIFNQARKDDLSGHYAEQSQRLPARNGAVIKN